MKKLLLIVFLVCIKQVNAQSVFAPMGTYWNYTGESGTFGTKTLQYYNDTTLNNYTCKKIKEWWYFQSGGPTPPDSGNAIEYIYQSHDSVFKYSPNNNQFQLLYSFSQNLHDTIYFSPQSPNYKLVLDSITHTTLCGTLRRVLHYTKIPMYCNTPPYDTVRVIEGLSYVNDYLFSQVPSCVVGDGFMYFDCANAQGCIYAPHGSGCTPLYGIAKFSTQNSTIKIYPNPANNKINIDAIDVIDIKLFDVLGKQITGTKENNVDVGNLTNGVYFIQVKTTQNTTTQKIMVQH